MHEETLASLMSLGQKQDYIYLRSMRLPGVLRQRIKDSLLTLPYLIDGDFLNVLFYFYF